MQSLFCNNKHFSIYYNAQQYKIYWMFSTYNYCLTKIMKKKIVFIWDKYAPYHLDRIESVQNLLGTTHDILAIQRTSHNETYAWDEVKEGRNFPLMTLHPKTNKAPPLKTLITQCRILLKQDVNYIFTCQYERPSTFFTAIICRLFGKQVFVMNDSKLDDKQRFLYREIGKSFLYLPYNGALTAGQRSAEYLYFLGFGNRPISLGYNTISIDRVRRNSEIEPAPNGIPFSKRHFTVVSRFVPKKNLLMLIDAYAQYRLMAGEDSRELHLCGSGPDEAKIRARIGELKLNGIIFHGFQQEKEVAKLLSSSLSLLIPSFEEQWGLVINEALAMGLPIICGDSVGARDALVKSAINGFAIEPDNPEGMARFMLNLSESEIEWKRMSQASIDMCMMADVARFALGVQELIKVRT
jgi:L-malate glycosyltransferase